MEKQAEWAAANQHISYFPVESLLRHPDPVCNSMAQFNLSLGLSWGQMSGSQSAWRNFLSYLCLVHGIGVGAVVEMIARPGTRISNICGVSQGEHWLETGARL